MSPSVRVAACQFAIGADVGINLANALRLADGAADEGAQLVVLPEFLNHSSWYDDSAHAWAVAVDLGGPFVAALGAKAAERGTWLMGNATVRRADGRITDTNLLFDDSGALVATSDKQLLMGAERLHISDAEDTAPIVDSPFGRLGMYSCMDGVIPETPRCLALRGAQVLLNSLNSFALDESSLHVPVRAGENKVWVVAANRVGPLLPAHVVGAVSERIGVDAAWLDGAGESQIVAPDGTVVAKAPRHGEAVIVADIDPSRSDDKRRPDGTDVVSARRPTLYAPIAAPPAGVRRTPGAESLHVAAGPAGSLEDAVAMVAAAVADGARLVVLPELVGPPVIDPAASAEEGSRLVDALRAVCSPAVVVTSVVRAAGQGWSHVGVVIDSGGVRHEQRQLHAVARHAWVTELGDCVDVLALPWGRLALVVGEDSIYPETFRLAALAEAEVVAVPFRVGERWEVTTGLVERAAENRLNVVAASMSTAAGTSMVVAAQRDFTLWTEWKEPFAGSINQPLVTRATATDSVIHATVHPATTANRLVSRDTDVVDGRPWRLVGAITDPLVTAQPSAPQ